MSMHKFFKNLRFNHSAERVVGRGAILHPGPKSLFCHNPERVVRFSWHAQHFEAHRCFYHSAERVVSQPRDTTR